MNKTLSNIHTFGGLKLGLKLDVVMCTSCVVELLLL